jgi:quinol monooxygenase YgiN
MTSQNARELLTIVCLLRPKPEQADTLRDTLLALVTPTRAEAGCLTYDLYEDAGGSFVLFENWRSEAALQNRQQQPAVRALSATA